MSGVPHVARKRNITINKFTIANAAAWLFILASISIGGFFGYKLGERYHFAIGVVFCLAAVAGEVIKPFAVSGVFLSLHWRNLQPGRALACLLMATVCIAYSLASDLALSAMLRGDLAAAREGATEALANARTDKSRAEAELSQLAPSRLVAEVEGEINKTMASDGRLAGCSGHWVPSSIVRQKCIDLETLRGELARAERRTALLGTIETANAALAKNTGERVKDSDPLASAIASYATFAGRKLSADDVSPWLALLIPLFIEVGSAFGLIVARTVERTNDGPAALQRSASERRSELAPNGTGRSVPNGADAGPDARVIGALAANGGVLVGSQRSISSVLGLSKTRTNEVLHSLAAAGRVELTTTPKETVVRLIDRRTLQ